MTLYLFQLPDHIEKVCPLAVIPCPSHQMGCEVKVSEHFKIHSLFSTITVCGSVSGRVQFPATFRKLSFLVKKRISMRNDSFQTFIDVSSFIISSGGFEVVVEGGNFKFT